jgi:hypothetical protein
VPLSSLRRRLRVFLEAERITTDVRQEPWGHLEEIVRAGDAQRLKAYIRSLSPKETARALSRLRQAEQTRLLLLLS